MTDPGHSLDDRISRHLDGLLSEEERDALMAEAEADPKTARALAMMLCVHASLIEKLDPDAMSVPEETRRRAGDSLLWTPRRHLFAPLAVAAGIAAVIATAWWMSGKGPRDEHMAGEGARRKGAVIARIEAVSGQWTVAGAASGKRPRDEHMAGEEVRAGMEIREGDWVVVGEGGRVRLAFVVKDTEVEIGSNAECGIRNAELLELRKGNLTARVEKRSEFAILTPHARAVIRGTAFSLGVGAESTRIEVTEGLVRFERLSDGKAIEVPADRYAVAGEGVELAALALPGRPADAPGVESAVILKKGDWPSPRTHLDGKVLFDDDFDGPLDKWEIVIGNPETGFNAVTVNPEGYWKVWKPEEGRAGGISRMNRPLGDSAEDVNWTIVNPSRKEVWDNKRFVGIRSLRPVGAERFVVEARLCFQWEGQCWIPAIEMIERHQRTLARPEKLGKYPLRFSLYRWEFERAKDDSGKDVFVCRHFLDGVFRESSRVTLMSRKLLFSCNRTDLCMNRVTVREWMKK